MSSSESDADEFFDAKDNLMSPTLSPSEKDNTFFHRFVYLSYQCLLSEFTPANEILKVNAHFMHSILPSC